MIFIITGIINNINCYRKGYLRKTRAFVSRFIAVKCGLITEPPIVKLKFIQWHVITT